MTRGQFTPKTRSTFARSSGEGRNRRRAVKAPEEVSCGTGWRASSSRSAQRRKQARCKWHRWALWTTRGAVREGRPLSLPRERDTPAGYPQLLLRGPLQRQGPLSRCAPRWKRGRGARRRSKRGSLSGRTKSPAIRPAGTWQRTNSGLLGRSSGPRELPAPTGFLRRFQADSRAG